MSTTYSRTENGSHPETAGSNEAIGRLRAIDRDKLPSDGGLQFNRLIFSASPYLLQHAENPVDWWPWGEESFAAARDENKPVFLSIGYATCHWCHVMAHESFEDEEVAQFLNRHFIPIKVDREERPDVDDQYMTAAQLMSGSGGWPLTIVMTPDRKPFFAATYLPKQARQGMPGLMEILAQVASLWNSDRSRIERHCAAILEALKESEQLPPPPDNCSNMSEMAEQQLRNIYDPHLGGFGRAPKFPMPLNHLFLIDRWEKTGNPHLLDMVATTLRQMRQGGIYDQIGYGFHRYSVDRKWLVPHFEKMLYDQALLALVYLKAGQVAEEPLFTAVASEILTFVLRDLTLDGGGFACALDADSEGREGACYVWTPELVKKAIGDEADVCCRFFGISAQGNFEGDSIPTFPCNAAELAGEFAMSPEQLAAAVERWRHTLLDARRQRIQPLRDEKVVTAWNGLAIAALARGYSATGRKEYLDAAEQAVGFIRVNLTTADGRLLRSWFDGRASIEGFLEDYAFLLWGMLELHAATRDSAWLAEAGLLAERMISTFGESGQGWLHDSAGEELLVCRPNLHDGVIPSGNSTAAMSLLSLGEITGNDRYTTSGRDIVAACLGEVSRQPLMSLFLLMAAERCP